MNEDVLIQEFKKGNHDAFNEIYRSYYKLLVIYAKQFVKDLQIAESITQDVFVTIYEKREQINIHTSLKSYLYTVVRNTALNYLKKESKHQNFEHIQDRFDEGENTEVINHVELAEKLYKAVEELPRKNKEIFKRSRFEGESNEEIANEMGLTKRTVETHISNALKRLREQLNMLTLTILFFLVHFFYVFLIISTLTYK